MLTNLSNLKSDFFPSCEIFLASRNPDTKWNKRVLLRKHASDASHKPKAISPGDVSE